MLQKIVIKRINKVVVGLTYEYSDDEVKQFMLAKLFKDCGYTYPEIKIEMENYRIDSLAVIDKAICKLTNKLNELKRILDFIKELKKKEEDKK